MTHLVTSGWQQVAKGQLVPQLPSGLSSINGVAVQWREEMSTPQNRKIAYLYQVIRRDGASSLLALRDEISPDDFRKLLKMTPATYKISKLVKISIQDLITFAFVDPKEGEYGTFSGRRQPLHKALSLADLVNLTPFLKLCMSSASRKEVLGALQLSYVDENNPKIQHIRRVAWEYFFEQTNVQVIDSGYSGSELVLRPKEARIIVLAAENSPDLHKLILKNYKLSEETAEIFRASSKSIDFSKCHISTTMGAKAFAFGLAMMVALAALCIFSDSLKTR